MSYFRGRNYFVGHDGTQNYLVLHSMNKYFQKIVNTKKISSWACKALSDKKISSIKTSEYNLNPKLKYLNGSMRLEFTGNCLKQDKATYTHGAILKIYYFKYR